MELTFSNLFYKLGAVEEFGVITALSINFSGMLPLQSLYLWILLTSFFVSRSIHSHRYS